MVSESSGTQVKTPETYLGSARAKNYILYSLKGPVQTIENGISEFAL
jgi:hypothetical protein